MKVFYSVDHDGHYPVGVASVVIAPDIETAYQLLDVDLRMNSLRPSTEYPYTFIEIDLTHAQSYLLANGDY